MSNDIRDRLQDVARQIAIGLPPNTGFVLLAFDFGPNGRMEYCSNAKRMDVIRAMLEFVEKTEEERYMKHCDEGPAAPSLKE